MSYEILMPRATAVNISPNPVQASTSFIIAVAITETLGILEPEIRYSGTFYAGEEG